MQLVKSVNDLRALTDIEGIESPWIDIDQSLIDRFADATGYHQWIHIDAERARLESPYGKTVAHGFLTLSLVPRMMDSCLRFDQKIGINYGLNKVRFVSPVTVDSRLRAVFKPVAVDSAGAAWQASWNVTLERYGADRPACVAEFLTRHVFF